jgi:hypothetical protein
MRETTNSDRQRGEEEIDRVCQHSLPWCSKESGCMLTSTYAHVNSHVCFFSENCQQRVTIKDAKVQANGTRCALTVTNRDAAVGKVRVFS